jgi:hypothetical protein
MPVVGVKKLRIERDGSDIDRKKNEDISKEKESRGIRVWAGGERGADTFWAEG